MDKVNSYVRSANMRQIKSKNTKPEILVRKLVYHMGFRYRIHYKQLPGKPDLVFTKQRKVIFVHGCFWHQHQDIKCQYMHYPKSSLDYWLPKLERTKVRDYNNINLINSLGWKCMIVWECELKDKDVCCRMK
jgi:DNA mismatch endonuclease (patch repair protein)